MADQPDLISLQHQSVPAGLPLTPCSERLPQATMHKLYRCLESSSVMGYEGTPGTSPRWSACAVLAELAAASVAAACRASALTASWLSSTASWGRWRRLKVQYLCMLYDHIWTEQRSCRSTRAITIISIPLRLNRTVQCLIMPGAAPATQQQHAARCLKIVGVAMVRPHRLGQHFVLPEMFASCASGESHLTPQTLCQTVVPSVAAHLNPYKRAVKNG